MSTVHTSEVGLMDDSESLQTMLINAVSIWCVDNFLPFAGNVLMFCCKEVHREIGDRISTLENNTIQGLHTVYAKLVQLQTTIANDKVDLLQHIDRLERQVKELQELVQSRKRPKRRKRII